MAKAQQAQVVITANAGMAKKIMDELRQKTEALLQRMKALDTTTAAGRKEYNRLEKQLVSYNSAMSQNITNTERIKNAMNDLSGTSLRDLRRALVAAKSELGKMSASSPRLGEMRDNIRSLEAQIEKVTGATKRQSRAWQTALHNLTAYVGFFAVFNTIKSKMTDILRLNLQYSDSLANIRKVSNLSMQSVNELSTKLAKIDSRTSLEGLTQLAYMGSRLGMAKYGTQGLADFAAAADRVNVALKEDLGDEAMLVLSKMVETMGEVEKHGGNISSAFDAVSSSIFKLASTSTANGGNIIEFAKRLTGMAKVTHVTTDELLALGSASDALMLMPEVSSTAFGKFIQSLWTNYGSIEQMLGMQKDSLKKYMENGQTMQALVEVLRNVSDKNLNSMDSYFKEFGSDGQRLKQVIVTMAQNIGVLEEHLDTSSTAYKEATAVSKEYAIQQQTAQAIVERANNMWEKAFVNPQGVDAVKEMAKMWYDFSKQLTKSQPFLVSVKVLFWEMSIALRALIGLLPGFLVYLGTRGMVGIMSKLLALSTGFRFATIIATLGHLKNAIMGNTVATGRLVVQWRALSTAMKANVVGLVLSVVASLGVAVYNLTKKTSSAKSSMEGFDHSLKSVYAAANQAEGEMDAYYRAILKANKGTEVRKAAIKAFNDKFKPYLSNLITEKSTVNDLAKAYEEAAKAIRAKVYLQMKESDIQKQYAPRVGYSLDRLNEYGDVAPDGQHGMEWLRAFATDTKGWGVDAVAAELGKVFGAAHTKGVMQEIKKGATKLDLDKPVDIGGLVYGGEDADEVVSRYEVSRTSANKGDEALFRAMRYIYQQRSANKALRDIDQKYKAVQDEMDAYLTSDTFTLNDNTSTDTKGGSGSKGGSEKKNPAKDRANALISNIKAFYEEQRRKYYEWVAEMNADGEQVSEGQVQQYLSVLEEHEKTATGLARESIATAGEEWDNFKNQLTSDTFQSASETDKRLLKDIGASNVAELHQLFLKLSADMSKETHTSLAENLGALLDEIFKNGTKDLREAAENVVKRQRELQKMLADMDYTGTVQRETRSNLDRNALLPAASEIDANSASGVQTMSSAFDALTKKVREAWTALYDFDVRTEEGRKSFIAFLSDPDISAGFDFQKLSISELQALWMELIKYPTAYSGAEKQAADMRKRVNDYDWSQTAYSKGYNANLPGAEQYSSIFGSYRNAGERLGMANISTDDPELRLIKMRMEYAQEYYKFIEEHQATEQQLAEARKSIIQEQAEYVKKLTSDMFEQYNSLMTFMSPLQTFGESIGEAFGTMREDAAEGKKAVLAAVKQMIKSFATQTIQLISQQQIEKAQTTAHYAALLAMRAGFDQAQVSQMIASGQTELAIQSANNTAQVNLEAIKETQMVALRSAGIFGWCVSTLGPIAGPVAYSAMMATLMGLLNYALSFIGSGSASSADVDTDVSSTTNKKLVSGMLTYDDGNVQTVVGNDGNVYQARTQSSLPAGVGLITSPTLTSVNGQSALVGEKGPEIVIGRETTRSMALNRPDLLSALYNYDRNRSRAGYIRMFDDGNTTEALTIQQTSTDGMDISSMQQTMTQMAVVMSALQQQLAKGIQANINMYGRGGLYESNQKANAFMNRYKK